MLIREMREEDLEEVIALDQKLFSHPYSLKDYLYEFNNNSYAHLYVLVDEHIIGFIDYWVIYERAELARIGIDPLFQSQGLGAHLFNEVSHYFNQVTSVSLEVRASNRKAIHLYEKLGFISQAVRKNYYENQEDGILMVKEVK